MPGDNDQIEVNTSLCSVTGLTIDTAFTNSHGRCLLNSREDEKHKKQPYEARSSKAMLSKSLRSNTARGQIHTLRMALWTEIASTPVLARKHS